MREQRAGPWGQQAGGGASLASGAGRADLTWPAPQSHSSPSSTKLFPQCAGGTRSPESGALDRHAPPPLRKKARSCLRLQALNTRGNGCLRAGKGVGRAGTPTPNPLLTSDPLPPRPRPSPRARPHTQSRVTRPLPELRAARILKR